MAQTPPRSSLWIVRFGNDEMCVPFPEALTHQEAEDLLIGNDGLRPSVDRGQRQRCHPLVPARDHAVPQRRTA